MILFTVICHTVNSDGALSRELTPRHFSLAPCDSRGWKNCFKQSDNSSVSCVQKEKAQAGVPYPMVGLSNWHLSQPILVIVCI